MGNANQQPAGSAGHELTEAAAGQVRLTKHHGLGNDFLIALNPPRPLSSADAKQWCDRRTGIGADGLIEARSTVDGGNRWTMILYNSDGSRAEISGNGIRCLGQAIGMASGIEEPAELSVDTDAGLRTLTVHPAHDDTWSVRVGMGPAAAGPGVSDAWSDTGVAVTDQVGVDIGNPHVVAVTNDDDFDRADMALVGPIIEAGYPGGINVHLVRIQDDTRLALKVWERGVGVTQACGSGACAAAWAANTMGLVGREITVSMPGGSATVELTDEEVFLTGPATYVGSVLLG